MANIIFKCPYLAGGSLKKTSRLRHYTQYIATREGVEILSQTDETKTVQLEKYVDYISNRPRVEKCGRHGLFSGLDRAVPLSDASRRIANHPGVVWLPIISLKRADAIKTGHDSARAWQATLSALAPKFAKAMKIPLDDFRWYAAFHDEGEHPHVHMLCYAEAGKAGYLTKKGIRMIKSALANHIFKEEMLLLYQDKTKRRTAVKARSKEKIDQLVNAIEKAPCDARFYEQFDALAAQLSSYQGKRAYAYLPVALKAEVDQLTDRLAEQPEIKAAYDAWQAVQAEITSFYTDREDGQHIFSKEAAFKSVKNELIRAADAYQKNVMRDLKALGDASITSPNRRALGRVATPSMHNHNTSSSANVRLNRFRRQQTVRLLHHVSRIFRGAFAHLFGDQRSVIDSKRLKKLREKKRQLGHRPDDEIKSLGLE